MIAIPYWLGGKNQREPSWVEVRRCIRLGMLSGKLLIAPIDLQRTTGLSMESSVTLIMEGRKEEMNEITLMAASAEKEAITNAMISFTKTSTIEAYTTGEMMHTLPTPVQEDIYTVCKAFSIPLVAVSSPDEFSSSATTNTVSTVKGINDINPLLQRIEQIHSHLLLYKTLHKNYNNDTIIENNNNNIHNPMNAQMFMLPVRNTNTGNANDNSSVNEFPPMTI